MCHSHPLDDESSNPADALSEIDLGLDEHHQLLNSLLNSATADGIDITGAPEEQIRAAINETIDEWADLTWNELQDQRKGLQREFNRGIRSFRKRLHQTWKTSLLSYAIHHQLFYETGVTFNDERRLPNENVSLRIDSLVRLHARACQLSHEIHCLLSMGFASGAQARWRSLHEVDVIARFLQRGSDSVNIQYRDHQCISDYAEVKDFNRFHKHFPHEEPFSTETIEELEAEVERVVKLHGPQFKSMYGWAANELGLKKVTFKDIEESVGLESGRVIYNMSLNSIHSGVKSITSSIGVEPGAPVLAAGASNLGLELVGPYAAKSLSSIARSMLLTSPTLRRCAEYRVLEKCSQYVYDSFVAEADSLYNSIAQVESPSREESNQTQN